MMRDPSRRPSATDASPRSARAGTPTPAGRIGMSALFGDLQESTANASSESTISVLRACMGFTPINSTGADPEVELFSPCPGPYPEVSLFSTVPRSG